MKLKEIWKTLDIFNGGYAVSSFGRIKSFEKYVKGKTGKRLLAERIFKPGITNGYFFITISDNYKTKRYSVHRLVSYAFLGLDLDNPRQLVCHRDDNAKNNYVDNLFLGTNKDNSEDMVKKGRTNGPKGERNHLAKLTKTKVKLIKLMLSMGNSQRFIAQHWNVSQNCIKNINKFYTWKHIN